MEVIIPVTIGLLILYYFRSLFIHPVSLQLLSEN